MPDISNTTPTTAASSVLSYQVKSISQMDIGLLQQLPRTVSGGPARLRFSADNGFHATLRERVEAYFSEHHNARTSANVNMWLKSVFILASYLACYIFLVWFAITWWQAVALSVVLGGLAALIGFNIQHDGGHHAYSGSLKKNRVVAATLDLIGASSYLWQWKHGIYHHGYPNISGHDTDINVGRVLRLEPHQPFLRHHRWQHLYIWLLYGIMAPRWQLYDDFREIANGAIGPHRIPRPRGGELALLIGGKLVFLSMALIVPMFFHPVWVVLLLYGLTSYTLGFLLSITFQLAHNTALVDFPRSSADGQIAQSWAEHQISTTADFARKNRVVTWLLGGLNYQVEHHLFPHVCHVHYPAISPIVAATCHEYGITFREHSTCLSGLREHYRWLRFLGNKPPNTLSVTV